MGKKKGFLDWSTPFNNKMHVNPIQYGVGWGVVVAQISNYIHHTHTSHHIAYTHTCTHGKYHAVTLETKI